MSTKTSYPGVFLAGLVLLLAPGLASQASAETTVVTSETTDFPTVVQEGDVLVIEPGAVAELSLENRGIIVNMGTLYGTLTNQKSGLVFNEGTFGMLVDNYGYFGNIGEYASPQHGAFQNRVTGLVENYGYFDSHSMDVVNRGNFDVMPGGTFFMFNGVSFQNTGKVSNDGSFYLSKTTDFYNTNGTFENAGQLYVGGYGTGSGSAFTNDADSLVSNTGTVTNHDYFYNGGEFDNNGVLYNRPVGLLSPLFDNSGTLDNNEGATVHNLDDSERPDPVAIRNHDTVNNLSMVINEGPDAEITNECGAVFNNAGTVEGNPVTDGCA
ncbi:MAG TPA: hypothetical protein VH677_03120 [Nitrososphaera sp.]|jgi:hypothetical protein